MHARFYHPAEIAIGQLIELSVENKHHAARVLRLKEGDAITLFNGHGGEFSAHIENISKSNTTVLIGAYHDFRHPSVIFNPSIWWAQTGVKSD